MRTSPDTDPMDRPWDNDEADLLLRRVADDEATLDEWRRFRALADAPGGAGLWRELGLQRADSRALRDGLADAPAPTAHAEPDRPGVIARIGGSARSWVGWAAAAAIGLAWLGAALPNGPGVPPDNHATNRASIIPVATFEDAIDAYLTKGRESGRVLREVPGREVVARVPTESGSVEVYFVRSYVERVEVQDLARFGIDDAGRPVAYPEPAQIRSVSDGRAL